MRTRDVTIPLALWICAAICAHFLLGTGGLVVAEVHDDRSELRRLSLAAGNLARREDQTFEVSLGESERRGPSRGAAAAPAAAAGGEAEARARGDRQKPIEKPKPEAKKEEKKVVVVEKKAETKPMVLPEDPLKDRRIAVRQHASPTSRTTRRRSSSPTRPTTSTTRRARRRRRTTATTSSPPPAATIPAATRSPATARRRASPRARPTRATRTARPARRAPTTTSSTSRRSRSSRSSRPGRPPRRHPRKAASAPPTNDADAAIAAGSAVGAEPTPGGATPPSPEVESSRRTAPGPSIPRGRAARRGRRPQRTAGSSAPNLPGGKMWSLPGLGQSAAPGAINTNLTQVQVASIVGLDNLRKLREADGERRKSEHRGSWIASNFERWRSAIENYVSSVKPGNQTALNTAQVPFASYLNGMHNRIHPIFADSFLESLDGLPPDHPMNDQHLVTRLEIVLTQGRAPAQDGHRQDERPDGVRHRRARRRRSRAAVRSGAGRHRLARRQRVPALGVSPRRGLRVLHAGRAAVHPEHAGAEGGDAAARPPSPASPAKERGAPPSSPNDAREGAAARRAAGHRRPIGRRSRTIRPRRERCTRLPGA